MTTSTLTATAACTSISSTITMGNLNGGTNNCKGGGTRMGFGRAYQIDRILTHKGKMIAGTKRRVYWKFGFANNDAVDAGLSAVDCRGQEHEIVLVWSLTSGKQLVLADGHEVHWGKTRSLEKFEKTWRMAGGHEIKVVAHSSSPLFTDSNKQFRQYDLIVDGISFYDMPQICDLGGGGGGNDNANIRYNHGVEDTGDHKSDRSLQQTAQQQRHNLSRSRNYNHCHSQPLLHDELDNADTASLSPSPSMPDLLDIYDSTGTLDTSSVLTETPQSQQPQHSQYTSTAHPHPHLYLSQPTLSNTFVSPYKTISPADGVSTSSGAAAASPCGYPTMAINAGMKSAYSTPTTVAMMTPSPVQQQPLHPRSSPRSVHDLVTTPTNPFDAFVNAPTVPSIVPAFTSSAVFGAHASSPYNTPPAYIHKQYQYQHVQTPTQQQQQHY